MGEGGYKKGARVRGGGGDGIAGKGEKEEKEPREKVKSYDPRVNTHVTGG